MHPDPAGALALPAAFAAALSAAFAAALSAAFAAGDAAPVTDILAALPDGPALAWLLAAALAGGLARGFSGFGAAVIFVPLASIGLGPRVAAPLMLVLEAVAILALTPGAWKLADRRQVGVMLRLGGRHAARRAGAGRHRPAGAALGGGAADPGAAGGA